jgi:hypothetical protein
VQRSLFAYALGDAEKKQFDTIRFNDQSASADRCEITDSAFLLRPVLAKSLLPEPKPVTAGGGAITEGKTTTIEKDEATTGGKDGGWTGGGVGAKIVKGERRLNRVRISMYVKWEDWNDIYNEVIDPLAKEGADLTCQVIVIAQGDSAIRENTVELGIKESLSQRGIKADIQTD